jgi:hypothetical protein
MLGCFMPVLDHIELGFNKKNKELLGSQLGEFNHGVV